MVSKEILFIRRLLVVLTPKFHFNLPRDMSWRVKSSNSFPAISFLSSWRSWPGQLLQEPETVAANLVPRMRAIQGNGTSIDYLTPLPALARVISGNACKLERMERVSWLNASKVVRTVKGDELYRRSLQPLPCQAQLNWHAFCIKSLEDLLMRSLNEVSWWSLWKPWSAGFSLQYLLLLIEDPAHFCTSHLQTRNFWVCSIQPVYCYGQLFDRCY